jgi:ATP-dependent helicase/nuclease subunit A
MDALVDWPGEDAYPRRFVFLASETHAPACVADALAIELAARSREELNALYVALTRTQHTLVLSSMQPRNPNPASWWGRLAPLALAIDQVPEASPPATTQTFAQADDSRAGPNGAASFDLLVLPELPLEARFGAVVRVAATGSAAAQIELAQDSDEARIGKAMHRLLEWLPVCSGGYAALATGPSESGIGRPQWSDAQREAVASQFTVDAPQLAQAVQMAEAIVTGAGAWAWDGDQLLWHHNEVPISRGGRLLRIDRLVQTRSDGQWWVLDYKSKAAPQKDADLCDQLLGYRAAIAQATPGQFIRAAFLTPQGALIEVNPL